MKIWRAILIPVLFAGFLSAQPRVASKQDDILGIYSVLMHGPVFQALGQRQGQCWAIVDTTINIDDMSPPLAPDATLKPPDYAPEPFREALADYSARKYQRQTIDHASQIGSSYKLISTQEAASFRASRTSASADTTGSAGSECGGITYFSDVYFSSKRNAALVYMLNWCGSLCSAGEWIYLENYNDRWVQRSGNAAITPGAKPF
jgi:hypothetical protein